MKGLCKTDCGCDVEYVPHEFSDGFTYYLPRNLDGTVHNCIFSEEEPNFFDIEADGWDDFALNFFKQFLQVFQFSRISNQVISKYKN